MEKVWFDFGDGQPREFAFATPEELNAFIEGVSAAAEGFGLDDYRQFDTQEEADAATEG